MTEREDEMTRAINNRAQKTLNREGNQEQSRESGKSYADFKEAQQRE